MIYAYKPHEVEAFQWGVEDTPQWFTDYMTENDLERQFGSGTVFLPIPGGTIQVAPGEWIYVKPDGQVLGADDETFTRDFAPVNPDQN